MGRGVLDQIFYAFHRLIKSFHHSYAVYRHLSYVGLTSKHNSEVGNLSVTSYLADMQIKEQGRGSTILSVFGPSIECCEQDVTYRVLF